ncbi:complex 1 protein [Dictyocaulus viviparus]|uniref:NADH dehydrogenase [ubiquinone] 1 beta subcomplex subunit 9 n=1 Tax=Dictyocaulus viviparus TaxID=29172 RepID=A0A0D8XEK5_DICVI|nr:complex 1 protein [Dictyocaulus viviparus]
MDSPAWMFTKALSHKQKVCRLYKRVLREIDSWYGGDILEVRYQKVIMRARFDANKDEKDTRKSQYLLADGCRQLWEKRHYKTLRFTRDPGGSSYDRDNESPDKCNLTLNIVNECFCQILDSDQWTLPEREQFPYYFNRREQRKKELLSHWSKIEKAWDEELDAIQTTLPKEKSTTRTM